MIFNFFTKIFAVVLYFITIMIHSKAYDNKPARIMSTSMINSFLPRSRVTKVVCDSKRAYIWADTTVYDHTAL